MTAEDKIKQLSSLLREAVDDMRCEIEDRYPPNTRFYPSEARRYKAEMDFILKCEKALEDVE